MRKLRIMAYKLTLLERRPIDCFFVIGPEYTSELEGEVNRAFRLWDWFELGGVARLANLGSDFTTWLESDNPDNAHRVVALMVNAGRPEGHELIDRAEEAGCTIVDAAYPDGDLHMAMLQEVAFHDIEIGGFDDFDGSPTRYSPIVVQKFSSVHARRFFPHSMIADLRAQFGEDIRFETLDVGCGILSTLRYGVLEGWLTLSGVDPLIESYEMLLARHGLDTLPSILPAHRFPVPVEELETDKRFHFIYSNNALDHTQDPLLAINKMHSVLLDEGLILIQGATHEGTRQSWKQLHKFDIGLEGDAVYARNEAGETVWLMGPDAPFTLHRVANFNDNNYSFIGQKAT